MTAREMVAAVVLVWLIGAIVGWCAGWAARGEQNRRWHRSVVGQMAGARAQLAQALDELDGVRGELDDRRRWQPSPAVVNVHVAAPPGWAAPQPHPQPQPGPQRLVVDAARVLDASPVGSGQQVRS